MENFLWQLVSNVFVFGVILGLIYLLLVWFRWKRRGRRNPICRDTLRGPGESLRKKIALLDEQINDLALYFVAIAMFAMSIIMTPTLKHGKAPGLGDFILSFIMLVILLPIPIVKLNRRLLERVHYLLGLDAELAVGRELNHVMREGFYVFHDFPEDHNNIDHVVVGPSGVFAVETKGRAKPDKDRGAIDATVIFKGDVLHFPDNVKETAALIQARKQATTLSNWLSRAVGESVKVRPVLAFPGWYVELKQPGDMIFLLGKSEHYAKALKGKEVLSEKMIKRIVHQLEAKCRDVVPVAYSANKKKPS